MATVDFKIHPPWYMTIWAYLLYAILVFSILYAIYRNKIKQLTKYGRLRTKTSSDLHDDVGTLLSSVAMQSEILELKADETEKNKYNKLSKMSREAMVRMRDTVWAIDSRKDSVESLIDRMKDFSMDLAETGKLKIDFEENVSKLSGSLPPDIRRNTYLIFKEAVNNAFKYSNGNHLKIRLSKKRNQFKMTIHDNGLVDPNKMATSGTGLSNMKMRAEQIGGTLRIDSSNGFLIELVVEK